MSVHTPVLTEASSERVAAAPVPTGPSCTLQRSGSLWQLGIEAQELTTAIGQLAEKLEADGDTRAQALAAKADASRADALEESLVLVLTRLQPSATRFSFPNHELSSRKSQAVEIDDEEALDSEWLTVTTTSKPDKAAIKEALKAGRHIEGAQLLSRRSWRIS